MKGKIGLIIGVVIVAMVVEAGVIYVLLPPKAQATTVAEKGDAKKETAKEDLAPDQDAEEESIDSFNCTNSKTPGTVVHVSFKLVAVVQTRDKMNFSEANKKHRTRVRQSVERVVRNASEEDLHDPNLSTLKRLIREEVNKVLGKSWMSEVVITDFRTMEQ